MAYFLWFMFMLIHYPVNICTRYRIFACSVLVSNVCRHISQFIFDFPSGIKVGSGLPSPIFKHRVSAACWPAGPTTLALTLPYQHKYAIVAMLQRPFFSFYIRVSTFASSSTALARSSTFAFCLYPLGSPRFCVPHSTPLLGLMVFACNHSIIPHQTSQATLQPMLTTKFAPKSGSSYIA